MTDQPKWTPGPWRYDRTNGSPTTGEHMIAGAKPGYLAEVRDCGSGDVRANTHLIAAAPDLYFGGEAQTDIIRHAQAILTQYLIPDGIDGPEAINQLLGLLDGPEQRAAQAAWDAALAKARGQA